MSVTLISSKERSSNSAMSASQRSLCVRLTRGSSGEGDEFLNITLSCVAYSTFINVL
jgi:hypothetical protein